MPQHEYVSVANVTTCLHRSVCVCVRVWASEFDGVGAYAAMYQQYNRHFSVRFQILNVHRSVNWYLNDNTCIDSEACRDSIWLCSPLYFNAMFVISTHFFRLARLLRDLKYLATGNLCLFFTIFWSDLFFIEKYLLIVTHFEESEERIESFLLAVRNYVIYLLLIVMW